MQDVEDFIDELPHDERRITQRLRLLILDADPRIRQKLSYGVPYFFRHRRLFFLWPASKPGLKKDSNRPRCKVTMGFCYGNLLSDEEGILLRDGLKQVYTIEFSSSAEINERQLSEIIAEALLVDEQFFRKPRR